MKLASLGVVLLLAMASCSSGATPLDGGEPDAGEDAQVATLRLLFVGNSYVSANDLPAVLSRIAATAGVAPLITVDSVLVGGADFMDHVAAGVALARIDEGGWTHVVLQDQSVAPTFRYFNQYRDHLGDDAEAAKVLGDRVVAVGAAPVWYATWAREASDVDGYYATFGTNPTQMQDLLTSAYARFAEAVPGSVVACVGEAFRRSLANHPDIVLHHADGSHPTIAGTYLTASTLYVALTGHPVPATSEIPAELGAADAAALREIALVGSTCAGYRAPAIVHIISDETFVAGAPQRRFVHIANWGDSIAGLSDGQTLAAPFSWASGAFPGYDDPRLAPAAPPCDAQLAPRKFSFDSCTAAITFSGAAPGTSVLTIDVTGAYQSQVSAQLQGETSDQPLLELHRDPSTTVAHPLFGFGATPDQAVISALRGETAVFHLLLTNVGGATAAGVTGGRYPGGGLPNTPFNDSEWSWGPTADPGATFPGGSGTLTLEGRSWPYCGDTIAVGATCVITASFTPPLEGLPPNSGGYWSRQVRVITEDQMTQARVGLHGSALD